MNVFYLHNKPEICAKQHNDKHVVKMIVEYAQILSTAHRMLDGEVYYEMSKNNRKIQRFFLNDEREKHLYKACHYNHPSTKWARQSNNNYTWLYTLWYHLCKEYTHRYGKIHKTDADLRDWLHLVPNRIPVGYLTQPPPAMKKFPQCIVEGDSIQSYRNYYKVAKASFNIWTKRDAPEWIVEKVGASA